MIFGKNFNNKKIIKINILSCLNKKIKIDSIIKIVYNIYIKKY